MNSGGDVALIVDHEPFQISPWRRGGLQGDVFLAFPGVAHLERDSVGSHAQHVVRVDNVGVLGARLPLYAGPGQVLVNAHHRDQVQLTS
eukprot:GAFH01004516.1.p2 GENE.GAFH01004516.1~~GAFH01004516.1.p2  ORF type:complete len:89 (+),score=5.82 GAFH01004516.1:150-416(+)